MAKAIRIGLDAHMVGSRETGNETYIKGLVDGFAALDNNYELLVYQHVNRWRPDTDHVRLCQVSAKSGAIRLAFGLPYRSVQDRLDVLHTTYTAPIWSAGKSVVTVHDITFATNPEWFSRRDLRVLSVGVGIAVRRAARVITVSNVCREQIIDHYRLRPETVVAIPNAAGPAAKPISPAEARAELEALGLRTDKPYVLAVGNLQPRKNLVRLIEAFRKLVAEGVDAELMLAGPRHYRSETVIAASREATDRIRFTGYLNDRQLAACYRSATVFAFPSLFEGFGIPALEAMAHDVPVACSKAGALPEVCGDAAEYFDPLDVDSIAAALRSVFTDELLRAKLIRAGRARRETFTWLKAARTTLSVYREAVGRPSTL